MYVPSLSSHRLIKKTFLQVALIAYRQELPYFYNVKHDYENLDREVTNLTASTVCRIFFTMAMYNVNISVQLY